MREGYRLQKNDLVDVVKKQHQCLAVFFIYTGNELPGYDLIIEKTGNTIRRLQKITHEAVAANL